MTAVLAAPSRVLLKQVLALAAPTSLLAVLLPFALLQQQMSAGAMGGGVVSAVARALGAQRRDEASALVLHALIIAVIGGLLYQNDADKPCVALDCSMRPANR